LSALSNRFPMDVRLNFFDKLDLIAMSVKRRGERVVRTEKYLEHLKRIPTKLVALDAFWSWIAVLQGSFSVFIIDLTKFS
jgi:hypothetical protein